MNQDLRQKLDHITNTFRASGSFNPVACLEQISYLIFLKLLDEEENERERGTSVGARDGKSRLLFSVQSARYRWQNWHLKSGNELRDYIRDEVFPYMASLGKSEPEVAEYFRDAELDIADPKILKDVIDGLEGLEINLLGLDVKGDVFEYLIDHLGSGSFNGHLRTPPQIRAFMVEMVDPEIGDTIFDPACGTGGFLIDAGDYLLAKYSDHVSECPIYGEDWMEKRGQSLAELKAEMPHLQTYRKGVGEKIPDWDVLETSIYGTDVSRQLIRIAMMNLVLHGIRHAHLKRANSLSDIGGLSEDDLSRKYKIILANPPFGAQLPKDSIRSDLPTSSRKSELLFLSLMLQHLAPGGRCAVVVPDGLLSGSAGSHVDLRKQLVSDFDLLAVVSLPAGVFKPYAGIKTAVLIFRKPATAAARRVRSIWFYEVRNDGYDPSKVAGGDRVETPELNDIPDLLWHWKRYKESDFSEAPGEEAKCVMQQGSAEPTSWWAKVEKVAEDGFNLAAGHWRPIVPQPINDESPRELVAGALDRYAKIVSGLERLLIEMPE